ncbi:MAG TPA: TlpA disulfide reductase family protein [Caulobacteraceae bacterium]
MNPFPAARTVTPARAAARLGVLAALAGVLYGIAGCSKTAGDLAPFATGGMAKLVVSAKPSPAPTVPFADAAGRSHTLAEFKGKVTLLNVWANWCAPCKLEIPSLAKLQAAYAGRPLAVVAVSLGKGEDETAGHAFIDKNPPLVFYSEPSYRLPYALRPPIEDVPTTIVYDRHGRERARLAGGADWSGAAAHALVDALLAEK